MRELTPTEMVLVHGGYTPLEIILGTTLIGTMIGGSMMPLHRLLTGQLNSLNDVHIAAIGVGMQGSAGMILGLLIGTGLVFFRSPSPSQSLKKGN